MVYLVLQANRQHSGTMQCDFRAVHINAANRNPRRAADGIAHCRHRKASFLRLCMLVGAVGYYRVGKRYRLVAFLADIGDYQAQRLTDLRGGKPDAGLGEHRLAHLPGEVADGVVNNGDLGGAGAKYRMRVKNNRQGGHCAGYNSTAMPAKPADYYLLALMLTRGVGAAFLRRLLDAFGDDARAATKASEIELRRVVPKNVAARVHAKEGEAAADAALKWSAQSDEHKLLMVGGDDYPHRLVHCSGAPLVLYACGQNPRILNADIIAIVGSRSASPGGVRNTEVFARALSENRIVVASGMAQGIDAAAHEGAISGGAGTIAVIGTGPDIVYPREHRKLAMRIRETGMIIGELPPGTPPSNLNFPMRNRIISGIARGCLVIEAGEKSGALITARHAMDNNREVFAVPGSINSPMHRGCHKLIKEGAKLTETINDINEELATGKKINGDSPDIINGAAGNADDNDNGGGGYDNILPHIDYEPTAADDIAGRSGLTAAALMPALLELEMEGKIAAAAGGKYQRLPA